MLEFKAAQGVEIDLSTAVRILTLFMMDRDYINVSGVLRSLDYAKADGHAFGYSLITGAKLYRLDNDWNGEPVYLISGYNGGRDVLTALVSWDSSGNIH